MEKLIKLKEILLEYGKICIAYSGGTDSDFLLNVAVDTLGCDNVAAIIGNGVMLAEKDLNDAMRLINKCNVKYEVLDMDVLQIEEFSNNDKERCYYCKKAIMIAILKKAGEMGYHYVLDGKNRDDAKVYRPGAKAAKELGIISPLSDAGFSKSEIRKCGKALGLGSHNKLSNSCLATRFPYNTKLTLEKLKAVEKAEKKIEDEGILGSRVRVHGELARIEVQKKYFNKMIDNEGIIQYLKELGFKYITLDLEGFRSGSMD